MSADAATPSTWPRRALQIPTDQPEADGTLRVGPNDTRHRRGRGRRDDGHRLHLYGRGAGAANRATRSQMWSCIAMLSTSRRIGVGAVEAGTQSRPRAASRLPRSLRIDIALWDLKAKLLDVPLVLLLGRWRERVPIYGSGGFTTYTDDALRRAACRLGRERWLPLGQDEDRHRPGTRSAAGCGGKAGDRRRRLFVDANGALRRASRRCTCRSYSREQRVTGSRSRCPPTISPALRFVRSACPPAWRSLPANMATRSTISARCWSGEPSMCMQADVTRCGGVTGFLQVAALCDAHHIDLSGHCAPAMHLHVACAAPRLRHLEWFHDHVRIEACCSTAPRCRTMG